MSIWTQKPPLGTQIIVGHPLARGLVGCWLFNEGGGLYAFDLSGRNNKGTLTNGPLWYPGRTGLSLSFDGADDYVSIPDLTSYFSTEATLIMWIKLANNIPPVAEETGIVYMGNSGFSSHYPYTDGIIYLDVFRNDRVTVGNVGVDKSRWHLLAITNKPGANNWKVYQNGIEIYNTTGEDTIMWTGGAGSIGRSLLSYHCLKGLIDEVRIYNRALRPEEIQWLYTGPYAMFEQPRRGKWFYVAPPAGGLSIPVAMNVYRQMRN